MPAFLLVGLPGSGKSTLSNELSSRGYTAIDADEDELLSGFRSYKGEPMVRTLTAEQSQTDAYRWVWKPKRIKQIIGTSLNQPLFLCGNAANANKFYPRFSKVFALIVADEQLHRQLAERPGGYGSVEADRIKIVGWNSGYQAEQLRLGAVGIDASLHPSAIADTLLGLCHED